MPSFSLKQAVVVIFALILIGGLLVFAVLYYGKVSAPTAAQPVEKISAPIRNVIGVSVEGRAIESFVYGTGDTHLAFVGGMHGGYEWNTALLAYQFIDYLNANPSIIPDNMTVAVIPSANPDGLYKVTGKTGRFTAQDVPANEESTVSGRFNARSVDLNRNFDCKWKPKSMWKGNTVSGGTGPFSEPETKAFRDFVSAYKPQAVIFWHSQANAVYASECENGILPETLDIMNAYARASGYPAFKSFDSYTINGDSEGWLASVNIPAITVELKTHQTIEWDRNLAGIKALFEYYGRTVADGSRPGL